MQSPTTITTTAPTSSSPSPPTNMQALNGDEKVETNSTSPQSSSLPTTHRGGLPPTRFWFVLFQHGLQGTVNNFALLKTVLASAIHEHNALVLEHWKARQQAAESSDQTPHQKDSTATTTAPNSSSAPPTLTPPPLRLIDMTPFDTTVNSWFKSMTGTVSTGNRLYIELRKGLIEWATEVATRVAVHHRSSLSKKGGCGGQGVGGTSSGCRRDSSPTSPTIGMTKQLTPSGDTDITTNYFDDAYDEEDENEKAEETNNDQEDEIAAGDKNDTTATTEDDDRCCDGTQLVTLIQDVYFSCVGHSFGGIILREVIAHIVEDKELRTLFEETGFACDFYDGAGSVESPSSSASRRASSPNSSPPDQQQQQHLPKRIVVKIRLQFATFASIVVPHCGAQRLSNVGKSISSIMSLFGSYTHHELLMHDVKSDDILTLVKEALEENPAKQKKQLSQSVDDKDEDKSKTKTKSVFSGKPLPPTTLKDDAPILAGRLLQPHFLEAFARFRNRTVYAAVNGDPFVTFQTGSFMFEGFVDFLRKTDYDHFENTDYHNHSDDPQFITKKCGDRTIVVRPYYGGRNQCRHRQGYVVRQSLYEAERDGDLSAGKKCEAATSNPTSTACGGSPSYGATSKGGPTTAEAAAIATLKSIRKQRFTSTAEELERLEEGYNISMNLKRSSTEGGGEDGEDDDTANTPLCDIVKSDDEDGANLNSTTVRTKAAAAKAQKLKAVEKIEEILNTFNSSVRRPIHPSLYPSVLPGITLGGDPICKAYLKHLAFQYASNLARLSMPGVTHPGTLAPIDVEDVVAATVLAAVEVDVVPIRSDLFLQATHKAVLGASKFGRPIGDAIEFIVMSLVADVAHY